MQPALDLTKDPELGVCDICEKILTCELFGTFFLCPECRARATEVIGREAAGRAADRLSQLHREKQQLEQQLNIWRGVAARRRVARGRGS